MIQLGTEIVDFGRNDLEEEVCLGLLRKTDTGICFSEAGYDLPEEQLTEYLPEHYRSSTWMELVE